MQRCGPLLGDVCPCFVGWGAMGLISVGSEVRSVGEEFEAWVQGGHWIEATA